jgi:hypothetical protein
MIQVRAAHIWSLACDVWKSDEDAWAFLNRGTTAPGGGLLFACATGDVARPLSPQGIGSAV